MEFYLNRLPNELDLMNKCSEKCSSERDPQRVEAKTVSQRPLIFICCYCALVLKTELQITVFLNDLRSKGDEVCGRTLRKPMKDDAAVL